MINYIIRRIGYGVLILIGVNLFTFMLFFTVNTPDDMARMNIGGKRVTQDAIEKWKVERGYDKPLFWNAKAEGIDKERLARWSKAVGWETLLNRAGTTFRKLPEVDKAGLTEKKAMALMLAQPSMIKRPVLEIGGKLLVGFKPETYAAEIK